MTFGSFVRTKRLEKGYTVRKFCERIDISQTFVSRMERDEIGAPSEEKIRGMAEALAVDPDTLILKAGKIPKDIKGMLIQNPHLILQIRQEIMKGK